MQKEVLKELFTQPLPGKQAQNKMSPSLRHLDTSFFDVSKKVRQSAVMIILFPSDEGLSTLYIKRPEYNGHHSAQVSFPGGKVDETDDSFQDTAIRECIEEIGVTIDKVDILGELTPLHIPVSNMMVYPFVAYLPEKPQLKIDEYEVSYAFDIQIKQLQNTNCLKEKEETFKGIPIQIPFYNVKDEEIWGATAMMTSELLTLLKKLS